MLSKIQTFVVFVCFVVFLTLCLSLVIWIDFGLLYLGCFCFSWFYLDGAIQVAQHSLKSPEGSVLTLNGTGDCPVFLLPGRGLCSDILKNA